MKNIKIITIFTVMILSAAVAVAQEETEGLIPKLIKRFKSEPAKPVAEKPVVPVKPAAPAMPAAQTAKAEAQGPVVKVGDTVKKMTKDELVKEITSEISDEEEALDYIPTLKMMKDPGGKEYLAYKEGAAMVRLEDLDRDRLESILLNIYNKVAIIRADRLQSQIAAIRQAENIARPPAVPRNIPVIPGASQQPPRAPVQPPKPPPSIPAQPKR
jgi:hypothetical protein